MNQNRYCFIDANLIMYAVGGPHPLREPCKMIFERIKSGEFLSVTNTEVLQEILHRYFSIGKPSIAEAAYTSLVQLCSAVLPVTVADTRKALDLLKTHQTITSRDAIHAATMINNGIKEIISTDTHFDMLSEIKRVDPLKFR